MKVSLLLTVGLIVWQSTCFAQCPTPGMKIQSAACADPWNLQTDTVSCSALTVKWMGSKAQQYIVKATGTDPVTNSDYQSTPAKVSCEESGLCKATLPVREGSVVSWSVQAVCTIEGAALYSSEVSGPSTRVPLCQKAPVSSERIAMHVYPNPANDYLMVQYDGIAAGTTTFRILDITGKKQFSKLDGTAAKANTQYKLDVRNLPPGMYLLEAAGEKHTDQLKFIILRN